MPFKFQISGKARKKCCFGIHKVTEQLPYDINMPESEPGLKEQQSELNLRQLRLDTSYQLGKANEILLKGTWRCKLES